MDGVESRTPSKINWRTGWRRLSSVAAVAVGCCFIPSAYTQWQSLSHQRDQAREQERNEAALKAENAKPKETNAFFRALGIDPSAMLNKIRKAAQLPLAPVKAPTWSDWAGVFVKPVLAGGAVFLVLWILGWIVEGFAQTAH